MDTIFLPLLVLLCGSASANFAIAEDSAPTPQLQTTLGKVSGTVRQVDGVEVEIFYGIPYSHPPLGMYRFGLSSPATPWSDVRDGTIKPPSCWQPTGQPATRFENSDLTKDDLNISEDCLYLNIWRPKKRTEAKSILVWIHGGGFWTGSAVLGEEEGAGIVAFEDVILVTIAYRLGALGFMFVADQMQGNAGIFDQAFAMDWLKRNARNLGGDPNDITIMGEGAGAASVGFHLLAPMSKDKFSKAIMQSGSPVAPWAFMDSGKASNRTVTVAENLGCNSSESLMTFWNCMRTISAENFTSEFMKFKESWDDLPLAPIIDNWHFKAHPREMLQSAEIKVTKVLVGLDKNEGIEKAALEFMPNYNIQKKPKLKNRKEFRDSILEIADGYEYLQKSLLGVYWREQPRNTNARVEILDNAVGDSLYKCPALDFAREYTKRGGQVYLYSLEDSISTNPWPKWMGVTHGSEIKVELGVPMLPNSGNTNPEKVLSQKFMELLVSFADNG